MKSVIKCLKMAILCSNGMGNNFSIFVQVGNRNLLRLKRCSFANGTDVDLSKLVTPPPLRGRGLIFHQFAGTEKPYLRFSLSPAWNLHHHRLISRGELTSHPNLMRFRARASDEDFVRIRIARPSRSKHSKLSLSFQNPFNPRKYLHRYSMRQTPIDEYQRDNGLIY